MAPKPGGGLVERLNLVDTPNCSEHGNKAVTPAPTSRPSEGIPPPRAQIKQEREVEREEA